MLFQKLAFPFTLLLCCISGMAQPVEFILQTDLLRPVAGYVAFSDCAVDMNGDQLDDVVRVGNKDIYIDYQQIDGSFTQRFFQYRSSLPPIGAFAPVTWITMGITTCFSAMNKVYPS
ncbi:MAG: hypothetical protein SH808_12015 [Saprospiraceae bacterium]|nr:hypothetical protein [Saprospiraceae bacterium]